MRQVLHKYSFNMLRALLLLAIIICFGITNSYAAIFNVTKTVDTNDGTCDADCSLREAIIASNANAGNDTINVPPGTYILQIAGTGEDLAATGDLDVTDTAGMLSIVGSGAANTIIQAGTSSANGIDRVFHTLANVSVDISNLTIRNGNAATAGGGGILMLGNVTLTNTTVSNNTADMGGGIMNTGGSGVLVISNSNLNDNTANNSSGGAIWSNNSATLTNVTLNNNSAVFDGGAIENAGGGTLNITNGTLDGNESHDTSGGAIFSNGTVTLNNVSISNNTASLGGGGIMNTGGGTLTLNNSTIRNNRLTDLNSTGGGIWTNGAVTLNQVTIDRNSAVSQGGGIQNSGGTLTITNSTLSGNSISDSSISGSGGAIWNNGTLTLTNATISGNSSGNAGGGIFNTGGGTSTLLYVTMSRNSAISSGGSLVRINGTVSLQNTIVANSQGGNCSGTMTSLGNNISSDGTCGLAGAGDVNNVDPHLAPLGNYGGPTETHPPLSGSPAIDTGNNVAPLNDQRGFSRPVDWDGIGGAVSDIGAVELQEDEQIIIPTMTEWGMIAFMVLAGLGAVYYLRRQRIAER